MNLFQAKLLPPLLFAIQTQEASANCGAQRNCVNCECTRFQQHALSASVFNSKPLLFTRHAKPNLPTQYIGALLLRCTASATASAAVADASAAAVSAPDALLAMYI